MAKIVHNDAAPSERVHYSLSGSAGAVEFDLQGKGSYETTDIAVIANAEVHPWLQVKREAVEVVGGDYVKFAPAPDGSWVNDPDEVRKAEAAKREGDEEVVPVAIDAGLKQTEAVLVDDTVAETLAADPTTKTKDKS